TGGLKGSPRATKLAWQRTVTPHPTSRRHAWPPNSRVTSRGAVVAWLLAALAITWLGPHSASQPSPAAAPPAPAGLAAFDRIATVLQSPRCLNCHPRGDRPGQGNDRQTHLMNVQRGPDDKGLPAMRCATCHQGHNNDRAGVPGAPHW